MSIKLKIFTLILMIFAHIVDDFNMQGWLAQAKQRKYWENDPVGKDDMYKSDYLMALFIHSFSWSFMIIVPIWIMSGLESVSWMIYTIPINTLGHMLCDDMKANVRCINLVQDQMFHLLQVLWTYGYWLVVVLPFFC